MLQELERVGYSCEGAKALAKLRTRHIGGYWCMPYAPLGLSTNDAAEDIGEFKYDVYGRQQRLPSLILCSFLLIFK